MRARMVLAAGSATLAVLAAAGCGGGSPTSAGSGAALGGAASIAPANTAAFVALDTDLGSSQWQALDGLLAKIPQHDKLVTELQQGFEQQTKLSWANDVKPALGPEVDVVVLPGAADGKAQVALLTKPADPSKLDALLQKAASSGTTKPVSTQVGGWTAISDSQAALDALKGATSHLADDSVYQEANAKLAADALVRVYANGAEAQKLVSSLGGKAPSASKLVWASADGVAESGGLRLHGFARTDGQTTEPYASALVNDIPSGALLVADFQARHETATASAPTTVPLLGDLGKLGASLGGETAVYLSPGVPMPSVTLVTEPSDPQAVLDSLGKLLGAAGSTLGGKSGSTGGLDLGGILGGIHLVHAQVGSRLVVSTSQQAIDAFKAGGDKLAADGTFQEAKTASGMPDKTTGFVYVNAKDLLPAAQAILALTGAKAPGAGVDLSAVRTLTAYGSGASGGVESFTVFLEVK